MGQKSRIAQDVAVALVVSFYLLVYIIMLQFEESLGFAMLMMACSPFMLAGLVLSSLRQGEYDGRELDGDEYGYHDRKNEELGIF